jgi:hypothetical protein
MVRGGDNYGIQVFSFKQLLVLRKIGLDFAIGAFFGAVEMPLVAVGNGNQISLLGLLYAFHQEAPANTIADETYIDPIARTRRPGQRRSLQMDWFPV